jgi:cytochrome c biogenesis protein CcmG/thiol:disulfide interchange protein DsbE
MMTRWVIAAAGALGVGVLTASALLGPTKHVAVLPEDMPLEAAHKTGACDSAKQADLDFTVKDMNNTRVRLSDYKGQVILVNFWATWCAPCKLEIPGFIELYEQYKDKGFVILGVSGDDDAETLRAFASEWKINYPVLVGKDEEKLLDAYGPLYGYPTSVLVGRTGAVCGRHVGPATKEEFEKEIKALL